MTEDGPQEQDAPMSARAEIVAGVVVALVAIVAVIGFFRLSAPAIAPAQPAPVSHYTLPCEWCHVRSADAPMIEVK